ncbi:MAG: sigma-70 family RNA polymerase sigma factor [Kofleriaceae bacterium]
MVVSSTQVMDAPSTSLEQCHQAGALAWPQFDVPLSTFEALVGARSVSQLEDAAELYLACGCAAGDAIALATFDREIMSGLRAMLRRMQLDDDDVSDVFQQLRIRLLTVGEGRSPHIVGYAGSGKLPALVRVVATRLALDVKRSRRRIAPLPIEDPLSTTAAHGDDVATMLEKAELRAALRRAFEEAATSLPRRERTLLRMSVLDGLTIDELATMHRVHRATVARWLVAARERLTTEARERFVALAGIEPHELAQVQNLVESQLSVSLARLLQSRG